MNVGQDAYRDVDSLTELPDPIVLDDGDGVYRPPRRADFEGTLAAAGAPSDGLSLLLLDLYGAAIRAEIGEFERTFLRLLTDYVPFDAAWTGVATLKADGPVNHNSFLHGLPLQFFSGWKEIRCCDPLCDPSRLIYGKAAVASVLDAAIDLEFRDWAAKHGLAYLLRVCALDNRFGLTTFLSIYRRGLDRPFSEEEKRRMEHIIPHLAAALEINRSSHLVRLQAETANTTARAICDSYGLLHQMDEGFAHVLTGEWPDWRGGKLPAPLIDHARRGGALPYTGNVLRLQFTKVAGLYLIEVRPRALTDRLSPQELTAIRYYGEGVSYKEVARRMNLSPATVRHYLRCAYKKLGMHDKGQIASALMLAS